MIIDSHCHLNYEPMSLSLKETIERANNDGVKYLLTISTEDKSFDKILKIIQEFKCVYGTYGIHPHEAKNHNTIKAADIIKKVESNKKIIGIGESGLDFYYNHSEKNDQIKCFEEHITAAQELQIPLIVHTRSAEKETLDIIKKYYEKSNLILDPHTAVGVGVANKLSLNDCVVLSTAHPCKFPDATENAIKKHENLPKELEHVLNKDENFEVLKNDIEVVKNFVRSKI